MKNKNVSELWTTCRGKVTKYNYSSSFSVYSPALLHRQTAERRNHSDGERFSLSYRRLCNFSHWHKREPEVQHSRKSFSSLTSTQEKLLFWRQEVTRDVFEAEYRVSRTFSFTRNRRLKRKRRCSRVFARRSDPSNAKKQINLDQYLMPEPHPAHSDGELT